MMHAEIRPMTRQLKTTLSTPPALFLRLQQTHPAFFLLESLGEARDLGRYSYIGLEPVALEDLTGPFELEQADQALQRIRCHCPPGLPPLSAGIVGHVSYHAVERLYPMKLERKPQLPTHQFYLALGLVVLDHQTQELTLVRNCLEDSAQSRLEATRWLDALETVLSEALVEPPLEKSAAPEPLVFRSSFSRQDYLRAVDRIQDYIRAGDVFQVVLSQQFTAHGHPDGFGLYRRLRLCNPSPYLSYIRFPGFEVLCSSPEMLVRMGPDLIETVPIAGTRAVLKDGEDDRRAAELAQDPKELAEHLMLVDLGRNDIGRVSCPGTVSVPSYCQVQQFAEVMHLVSKVHGVPQPGIGPAAGLFSAFPAGTVTGAPKLRAMEIIDELEPCPRELYAGAIVMLDPQGALNSCIAIRTITLRQGLITVQAGAGIVHDSVPEAEYQETLNKASALFRAIEASTAGGVRYDFGD